MLQLLLMRHGKSDWDADYGADHDRPLAARGVRSARIMGRLLTAVDRAPDLIISSSAIRATSTAHLTAETGGWSVEIVEDRRIYGGNADAVLGAVGAHGGAAQRVMVVGHEPTWSALVTQIVGARVEMKTASVAGVGMLIDEWVSIENATGWLDFLLHPRMFFGTQFDTR